jgi:hypothetical protein
MGTVWGATVTVLRPRSLSEYCLWPMTFE